VKPNGIEIAKNNLPPFIALLPFVQQFFAL
jgi:hypothetical protein